MSAAGPPSVTSEKANGKRDGKWVVPKVNWGLIMYLMVAL